MAWGHREAGGGWGAAESLPWGSGRVWPLGDEANARILCGQGPDGPGGLWAEDLDGPVVPWSTSPSPFTATSQRRLWLKKRMLRIQRDLETSALKQCPVRLAM